MAEEHSLTIKKHWNRWWIIDNSTKGPTNPKVKAGDTITWGAAFARQTAVSAHLMLLPDTPFVDPDNPDSDQKTFTINAGDTQTLKVKRTKQKKTQTYHYAVLIKKGEPHNYEYVAGENSPPGVKVKP